MPALEAMARQLGPLDKLPPMPKLQWISWRDSSTLRQFDKLTTGKLRAGKHDRPFDLASAFVKTTARQAGQAGIRRKQPL